MYKDQPNTKESISAKLGLGKPTLNVPVRETASKCVSDKACGTAERAHFLTIQLLDRLQPIMDQAEDCKTGGCPVLRPMPEYFSDLYGRLVSIDDSLDILEGILSRLEI